MVLTLYLFQEILINTFKSFGNTFTVHGGDIDGTFIIIILSKCIQDEEIPTKCTILPSCFAMYYLKPATSLYKMYSSR